MDSEEYPSVRRALFGEDDRAANLWCGVKWVVWQATHLLLALLLVAAGLLLAIPFLVWFGLKKGGETGPGEKARETLRGIGSNPKVVKGVRCFLYLAMAVIVSLVVAITVWFLIYEPEALLIGTLAALGFLALLALVIGLVESVFPWLGRKMQPVLEYFGYVREKSEDTPVARRVVGYCPVSMDINPRWFEKLFEP